MLDEINHADREKVEIALKKLEEWKKEINSTLNKEFNNHIDRTIEIHPEGARMVKYLRDFSMRGGKRIRPACVIAGYKAVGGQHHNKIVETSLATEALQSFVLIHDDIQDQDDQRRNGSTLHKMYEEYVKNNIATDKYEKIGENLGINVGNLANSFGVNQILKSKFEPEAKIEAVKKFEDIKKHTAMGQFIDEIIQAKKIADTREEEIESLVTEKTAHYTMAGPLELGAILGEATEEQKQTLKQYGMKVGKAFQLYDDMLDLYGEEEKTGKPIGSDIREGKKTLLILQALRKANKEQENKIKQTLGDKRITNKDVEEIREIVKDTGAYEYSKKRVNELVNEAKNVLNNSDNLEPEIKDFLLGIADYIITREV